MGQQQKTEEYLARRKFLLQSAGLLGATAFTGLPDFASASKEKPGLTIKEVIEILIKDIPGAPFERTVDQLTQIAAIRL